LPGPTKRRFPKTLLVQGLVDRLARRSAGEPPTQAVAASGRVGWRLVAATLGLSFAGVAAPIAVTATAASGGLLGPPPVASALVGFLVLAPAGVGLATALSGLRRLASVLGARVDNGGGDAEQAVLRVLVDALLFFYALGVSALTPGPGPAAPYLAIAAFALVAAWAMLLYVILSPAAPKLRGLAAAVLDIALFSAFLHYGGGAVAGWYPLYLLATLYAGFRFGLGALLGNASLDILGFGGVVLSTEFWHQQPVLAAGLIAALAVVPGSVAGAIRALASARDKAASADADRRRTLRLIADNLRAPLTAARALGAAASELGDVLDFAALDAGSFAAPVEAFDLRALVTGSLMPLQAAAAEAGVVLRWRVDPHLPSRLRGRARALARLLASLAGRHAVPAAAPGTVRMIFDAAAGNARRLQLRLLVETAGGEPAPDPGPLPLLLVQRLAALMGGALAIERTQGGRTRFAVSVALATEEGTGEPILDLGQRPVLIATEDEQFAGELAEPVAAWHGDVRWAADADAALAALSCGDPVERPLKVPILVPVLIIDGRRKLLWALSLAHRAARLGPAAPFVLLAAEPGQIEGLGDVDEGEVDGFIPLPLKEQLLANALHGLPLGPFGSVRPPIPGRPAMPRFTALPREPSGEPTGQFGDRITPIAAHPKYIPEAAASLDMRAIDGLRELGGDPAFLGELIETFQVDARQIMERLDRAVAAADAEGVAQSLHALRRAASPLGATQLCEFLASLQGLAAGELRQLGASHVQRLDAEIERLAAALTEIAASAEVRQP